MNTNASTFAAVLLTLLVAHMWGDHSAQTDHQAAHKGRPGPDSGTTNAESWRAMLGHLVSYHAVMIVMLAAVVFALDLRVGVTGCAAGVAFLVVTHGFWDRRWPVALFMRITRSPQWAKDPQGRYLVDQSQHWLCLWLASLLIVLV
ncbi:DUF3307 domain-containing protein [Streptomyces sp. NRRL S-350]|uniref:DUF3307 domain-containing protein n=1 Tax=Streptomyces sp. NRRL S-350 TaxID=1463902 RepID=UPI000564CA90|nr:DUF3307 domain-containing protein [Streptomyces sp. NRRL S-350]